jgi:hypothetical protein
MQNNDDTFYLKVPMNQSVSRTRHIRTRRRKKIDDDDNKNILSPPHGNHDDDGKNNRENNNARHDIIKEHYFGTSTDDRKTSNWAEGYVYYRILVFVWLVLIFVGYKLKIKLRTICRRLVVCFH